MVDELQQQILNVEEICQQESSTTAIGDKQ